MALQTEVWIQTIQETLFQGQEFISKSEDHSAFVKDTIVHLPQSGASPNVEVNRSSFPATIAERTDTEKTYNLRNYSIDPIRLRDLDEIQTSYSKRTSIMNQHIELLNETIGNNTANDWGIDSGVRIVKTSGSLVSDALAPGATGTRKRIERVDIRGLAKILDKDNVSSNNRFLLMPTDLFYQLFADDNNVSRDFMLKASQEQGVITELYGFKIMKRPSVNVYDSSFDKKAVGAATAVTDDLGCVAWQSSFVSNAVGDIRVFANEGVAEHFGSIFSAEVEHAGAILRSDLKGVTALVQTA